MAQPSSLAAELAAAGISSPHTIAARVFGRGQSLLETRTTVGLAVQQLLLNRPDRNGFLIVNLSASLITIGFSAQVLAGSGIVIQASGGFFAMDILNDGVLCGWPVFAIGSAAALAVYVVESVNVEHSGRG